MDRLRDWVAGVAFLGLCFAGAAHASAQAGARAGTVKALSWADLVNRPELWPPVTKLTATLKFTSGDSLKAGTPLHVSQVSPAEVTVVIPDGSLLALEPADCDLVQAANAYRATLTPEQQALDLRAVAADPTLVPDEVTVYAALRSEIGSLDSGSVARVLKLEGSQVFIAKDFVYSALEYGRTDLLHRARELRALPLEKRPKQVYLDSLSAEQKSVTLRTLAEDPSLIPARVTVWMPLSDQGTNLPAGSELQLLKVKGDQVEVSGERLDLFVDASDTDVLRRARELRGMPLEKRPSRIPAMLAGTTIDVEGKPVDVKAADYYLFYFASSTCPRCNAYTPQFVERYKKSLAERPEVAVVTLSNNGTAEAALAFAHSMGTTWPIVPGEKRRDALNAYHVTLQPGMVVVDRFGKILATNAPGFPSLDTVDAVLDQLDKLVSEAPAKSENGKKDDSESGR